MSDNVQWYGTQVRGEVTHALEAAIAKIAFDIEAATKVAITDNQQIDTGFMRNSVYAQIKRQGIHGGIGSGRYTDLRGRSVLRESAPIPPLGDADAIVGVGAVYAIYNEVRRSFLRVSFERVIGAAGGKVQIEFRQRGF